MIGSAVSLLRLGGSSPPPLQIIAAVLTAALSYSIELIVLPVTHCDCESSRALSPAPQASHHRSEKEKIEKN